MKRLGLVLAGLMLLWVGLMSSALFVGGAGLARASDCGGLGSPAVSVNLGALPTSVGAFKGEQLVNAALIMNAGKALGVSRRGQTIAVMTAIGESTLKVLPYGDSAGPDSRGLFQQRDNGAWGTLADRMDPTTSATMFYKALLKVSGWEQMEPTLAANSVQRNADPLHYAQFWEPAVRIVEALGAATTAPSSPIVSQVNASSTMTGAEAIARYRLGNVRPITADAVARLAPMFGIATVGGYRPTTNVPDHEVGLAADFMVPTTEAGRAQGDRLAAYAIQNAREMGIDYVLWSQRSWNTERGTWRPMEDRGSVTQNHQDHVHITFVGDKSAGNLSASSACIPGEGDIPVAKGGWSRPVEGPVTSEFNPARVHPITGIVKPHTGTDFGAACNSPIRAARAGRVVYVGPRGTYGNLIEIDHGGGTTTRYAHMYDDGILTRIGATVQGGQVIGSVGASGASTGCNLHFEVRTGGTPVNPRTVLTDLL